MKTIGTIIVAAVLIGLSPARAADDPPPIRGTFIQLNPELAERDARWWDGLFGRIAAAGIGEVTVQYLADGLGEEAEDYLPALEPIFPAAEAHGVDLVLGLEHDPNWWVEITAPEKVLRDYLLLRAARHLRLQERLLDLYGDRPAWTGYYVPDEVDDLSWRDTTRRRLLGESLGVLADRLREKDPEREIAISVFFRGRTEPALAARNFFEIDGGAFDLLLLQDGQGGGDPDIAVLPLYYRALAENLPEDSRARLAAVVEIFEETTPEDGKFSARPADPELVEERLRAAAADLPEIHLFSFIAYADPEKDPRAAAVYGTLLRYQREAGVIVGDTPNLPTSGSSSL